MVMGPSRSARRSALHRGRSTVLAVAASVRTMVWFRGGEELGRTDVNLSPDGLNELGP